MSQYGSRAKYETAVRQIRQSRRNEESSSRTPLQSSTDETGYVPPTRDELVAVRGLHSNYHYNGIQSWTIGADGTVKSA